MKIFTFFVFLFFCIFSLYSGQLSPQLTRIKNDYLRNKESFVKNAPDNHLLLGLESSGGVPFITTTMSVKNTTALNTLGIPYTVITDTVVVAQVPMNLIDSLEQEDTIGYIQSDYMNETHNDIATSKIGSLVAHSQSFYGDDVLIGIIDTGIDFKHNAFKIDGDPTKGTRILYLWDQTKAFFTQFTVGSFTSNKGRRWTSTEINNNSCDQLDINGHGTHVAGSFGGFDADYPMRKGTASKANLIVVKTTLSSSDVLAAVRYLHEQAKSIGKPIVVNMSLGSKFGPHDGTDLDTKAIDDLIAGSNGDFIVVRSAGNNGSDGHHDSATITSSSSSMPITIPSYTPSTQIQEVVLANYYYSYYSSVQVKITSPSGANTGWLQPSSSVYSGSLGSDGRYYIHSRPTAETYNAGIKNIYVEIGESSASASGENPATGTWNIEFSIYSGSNTTLHGWIYYSWLSAARFSDPDHNYTLGNGACGNNVIVVGAYVSRQAWTAINGTYNLGSSYIQDAIAPFSSIGPTRDGRQKPDIVAPGSMILSTLSTNSICDNEYKSPTGNYRFMQGTSMATPLAAGAIAILKQKNPLWSYSDVITYFKTNSQGTPGYSGHNSYSTTWGWGVIDIKNAIGVNFNDFTIASHNTSGFYAYKTGQNITISWLPAASDDVTINYSVELKHEDGDWYTASTIVNSTSQELNTSVLFTDGVGNYSLRIKAEDAAGVLPTRYSDNTITTIYFTSLNSPQLSLKIHDGLRPNSSFIHYANGNENFNVHWLDDSNSNSGVTYYYQFVWGTTEGTKTAVPSITVAQGYEGFDALNVNLGNFKKLPTHIRFWIVNNSDVKDRVYFEKSFFIRNVVWELLPYSIDSNKVKVVALLQNATEDDIASDCISLRARDGSVGIYYQSLHSLQNGLYVAPQGLALESFSLGIVFDLFYNNLTTSQSDDYLISTSKTKTTYALSSSPVSISRKLSIKCDGTSQVVYTLPVTNFDLSGIPYIKGDVFYIGNVTGSILLIPEKGYKVMKLHASSWSVVSQITQSGYYAVVEGNIPSVKKTTVKGNFPNPFNPETTIVFELEQPGMVDIEIFTARGKTVLRNRIEGSEGANDFHWNGKDSRGVSMPSGVYYFALSVHGKRYVTKMIMLK